MKIKRMIAFLLTLLLVLQIFTASISVSAGSKLGAARPGAHRLNSYTSSDAKKYILSAIDYYLTKNSYAYGTVIFMFEGANKNANPYAIGGLRNQAIAVVLKGEEIIHVEGNCSTIPDDPNMVLNGRHVATVLDGTYGLHTINHGEKAWYEFFFLSDITSNITDNRYAAFALNNDHEVSCLRLNEGVTTASLIHLHSRDDINANYGIPNSVGCILVGERNTFYNFVNLITGEESFENRKQVWKNGDLNQQCGWIVIDRQLAKAKLASFAYGGSITTITAASKGAWAAAFGSGDSVYPDPSPSGNTDSSVTVTVEDFNIVQYKEPHNIIGRVDSDAPLSRVAAAIYRTSDNSLALPRVSITNEEADLSTPFLLEPSRINHELKFGELAPGNYKLQVAAKDVNGNSDVYPVYFSVIAPENTIKILLGKELREARLNNEDLTIEYGTPVVVDATISSNYNLTTVAGAIYRRGEVDSGTPKQKKVISVNTSSYSLKGSPIDKNLKFGELDPGKYTLRLAAKDDHGGVSHYCVDFNVNIKVSVEAIGTIPFGKPYNITGKICSGNNKLIRVAAKILDSNNKEVKGFHIVDESISKNRYYTYDLISSTINQQLKFANLLPGKYKLKIAARDVCDNTGSTVVPFTVSGLSISANEKTVYDYLTKTLRFNKAAACGVLANIYCESGVNPNASGDYLNGSPTSYGLCQWHNERWDNLKRSHPSNWRTIQGQLDYLNDELKKEYYYVGIYLKGVSNSQAGAKDAADYFCRYYEIPYDVNGESAKRGARAMAYYYSF